MVIGIPKGGTNRYWSKEAKYEYVKLVISGEISSNEVCKLNNISKSLIFKWVNQYLEGGVEALENKRKPGNPLMRYQRRKELTPLEQLQYENMKLRIEIERLKKGYSTEEVEKLKQKRQSKKNMK
jgi:transposase-like protein